MDADGRIKGKKNNKGIALVYAALFIVVIVAFVGIVVDIGYMYVAKGQLQNAADSAALAGAARLLKSSSPSSFGNYSAVRREAFKFACANKIVPADSRVFLVYSSAVCDPITSRLNPGNKPDGDIVVGYWDGTTFHAPPDEPLPAGSRINAVKVVARKTSEPSEPDVKIGNNPVTIFFGRVLSAVGLTRWSHMSARAQAIAVNEPFLAPIPICLPSCNLNTPLDGKWGYEKNELDPILCTDKDGSPPGQMFFLAPSSQAEDPKRPGIAWTNFDTSDPCPAKPCNMPNKGEILPYLRGEKEPPDICGKNICTTNGNIANLLDDLEERFNANKKEFFFNISGAPPGTPPISVTGWMVLVPVVSDSLCGVAQQSCPGAQGGQANHYLVQGFAKILITQVARTGQEGPGIRIVGFASPRSMNQTVSCNKGAQTIVRNITSIASAGSSCFNCDVPPDGPLFPPRLVK